MSFVIRSNGGIESEAKKEPERLRRTSWRRLGGPWQAARRRLEALEALLGVSRVSQGGSRELPGRPGERLGVLPGRHGEALGSILELRGGVGSRNSVNMEIMELLKF